MEGFIWLTKTLPPILGTVNYSSSNNDSMCTWRREQKKVNTSHSNAMREHEKGKNQAFQTSDLVDAFVQISIIDRQDPETRISAYHQSSCDTIFVLQEWENSLYGTGNVW